MNTLIDQTPSVLQTVTHKESRLEVAQAIASCNLEVSRFVQQVVESLVDGVLILTEEGTTLYDNQCARRLCQILTSPSLSRNQVPPVIWKLCEALIESRSLFPNHLVMLEEEIRKPSCLVRVRVRWIDLPNIDQPCLAVMLEDRYQSLQQTALAEAHQYGLTEREAEVWLLRRANRTYKAIAAELHIALDTVKKHIKSIHAKREAFQWADE